MDQCRVVFQRLHQIGLQGIAQQHRHRAIGADIAGGHRLAVGILADHDPAQPRLKIGQIRGQAQDRHHLGGHGDVEAAFARLAVGGAAKPDHRMAQRAVVHVHHPPPCHPARVDPQFIAPMDVVVDHRRQ